MNLDLDLVYSKENEPIIGQRLGIDFVRSNAEELTVLLSSSSSLSSSEEGKQLLLSQSNVGMLSISSVIWDAGLHLVDYLVFLHHLPNTSSLGHVLEIGCGTGVCGVSACFLGAKSMTFTDCFASIVFEQNRALVPPDIPTTFVPYNWEQDSLPPELLSSPSFENLPENNNDNNNNNNNSNEEKKEDRRKWDTIICSDVLYEAKLHKVLMMFLKKLSFRQLILSYKRRTDEPERKFLEQLQEWCTIELVDKSMIPCVNLPPAATSGVFLFLIKPR